MPFYKLLVALIPALAAAACVGPAVNDATLDLLKGYEKMIPNPYDDGYGNPTIGYGHLCQDFSCSDIPYSQPLTEETATKLLADDLEVRDHDVLVFPFSIGIYLSMPPRHFLFSSCSMTHFTKP